MKKTVYFASLALAGSLFFACAPKAVESFEFITSGEETTIEALTADSIPYVIINKPLISNFDLAPKDADGYVTIFDGKTFNGWRGYEKDTVPGLWVIEDGAIKFSGSDGGEAQTSDGGDLIFAYKFKNFELTFDWKVAKSSNSGILYLAQEIKGEHIYISSPEYQILDNENHPDAKLGVDGNRKSASLYDMIPANPQESKPFGEWNTGAIIVYKGSVSHFQNGKAVLEYHLWTPEWTKLLQESKFSQEKWPLAYDLLNNLGGANHEGYIGLQDHSDVVWYKNIKVKILD
jgi:hypothetical protein